MFFDSFVWYQIFVSFTFHDKISTILYNFRNVKFNAVKKWGNKKSYWVTELLNFFSFGWPVPKCVYVFCNFLPSAQMMNMNGICKWNIRNFCMWIMLIECSMWWKINKYFMLLSHFFFICSWSLLRRRHCTDEGE